MTPPQGRQNDVLILETLIEMKGDMGKMKGDISSELTERLEQHDLRQEARTVRLEEKMDNALRVHIKDDDERFSRIEEKQGAYERDRAKVIGGAKVVTAVGALGAGAWNFRDAIGKLWRAFIGV